jgi:hypothetical protein
MIEISSNSSQDDTKIQPLDQIFAPGHINGITKALNELDKTLFLEMVLQEIRNDISPVTSIIGLKKLEDKYSPPAVLKLYKLLNFINSQSILAKKTDKIISIDYDIDIYNDNINQPMTDESRRALDLYLKIINIVKANNSK